MILSRRSFSQALAGIAASVQGMFALDPEKALWVPGAKTISIPSPVVDPRARLVTTCLVYDGPDYYVTHDLFPDRKTVVVNIVDKKTGKVSVSPRSLMVTKQAWEKVTTASALIGASMIVDPGEALVRRRQVRQTARTLRDTMNKLYADGYYD